MVIVFCRQGVGVGQANPNKAVYISRQKNCPIRARCIDRADKHSKRILEYCGSSQVHHFRALALVIRLKTVKLNLRLKR